MDCVGIMDQKTAAYRLDHKSKYRFYLIIFFDLTDVTHVNSHTVYMKLGDDISLMNLKIIVTKALTGRSSNNKRLFTTSRLKFHELPMPEKVLTHMYEFKQKPIRCYYCKHES